MQIIKNFNFANNIKFLLILIFKLPKNTIIMILKTIRMRFFFILKLFNK